jgi:hypothetical protein
VDLSDYNGIARATTSARATWYTLSSPQSTEVYRLVIDGRYMLRLPFYPEPFVRSEYVPNDRGVVQRQKVTRLTTKPRHAVEAGITWNVSELVGIRAQYRFGSLPPLFEFVNHQVTIGLTFKAQLQ